MNELNFDTAMELAESLKTIPGFPWSLVATAEDLVRWCKGATVDGRTYSPEDQAQWLTTEIRERWERWEGTATMRSVFQQKFERHKLGPAYQATPTAAELEAQYGKPDPDWPRDVVKLALSPKVHAEQLRAATLQSIRDCLYYTEGAGRLKTKESGFWQEGMDRHEKDHATELNVLREAIRRGHLSAEPPVPEYSTGHKNHSLTQTEFENLKKKQELGL